MKDTRFLYQIRAEAEKEDEAEILIYDEIGKSWFGEGIGAQDFVKDLAKLTAKKLTVRINSGGGQVFEGLAIYNALKRYNGQVVVEIDSLAASIASIIALAGEEVRIAENAFFMIHDPSGLAWGTAEEMREMAALLDKVGGSLSAIYVEASGATEKQVQDWMSAETWFTAAEAKEAGFVDVVLAGKEIKASADLGSFRNAPAQLRAVLAELEKESTEEDEDDEKKKAGAAAGDAEPDEEDTPKPPASKAKENTMSDKDTAAQTIAAERDRVKSIRAIGDTHKMPAAKVNEWIDGGKSVDEVNALVLAEIRAKAAAAPSIHMRERAGDDPQRGFGGHQDFFMAVLDAEGVRSVADVSDERLRPLAITDDGDKKLGVGLSFLMPRAFNTKHIRAAAGSDEQGTYSDQYGGFAVPESTLPGMLSVEFEGDPTVGKTAMVPMATPIVKILARTDKDHTTAVSGGFTVTRRPETVDFASSRAKIERIQLQASSLVGLAFETEELIEASPGTFAALIDNGFRDQFAAHVLNEKIRGTGVGEYEGILNAACKVEIAKETGQGADTIIYKNILKMRARCWGYGNAIWLANHDTLPELAQMSLAVGTGGAPVFIPGQFGGQIDTLMGRPIYFSEYPSTVGDAGDIILWNPTQYLEGIYQPLKTAESVHVRFVQHERAFKLWLQNAGASWWRSALTPAKGSNTLSPIVTLAARA